MFRKENSMIYKCHNCGVGASFKNFLKHVDSKIYNEYILERYKKKEVELDITQFKQPKILVRRFTIKISYQSFNIGAYTPCKRNF